jgi:hypothetical protein
MAFAGARCHDPQSARKVWGRPDFYATSRLVILVELDLIVETPVRAQLWNPFHSSLDTGKAVPVWGLGRQYR